MLVHDLGFKYFSDFEKAIRFGEQPESPELLIRYLDFGDHMAQKSSNVSPFEVYSKLYRTLIEAICDSLVPKPWRSLCLNNVYRPLLEMDRLAKSSFERKRVQFFYSELTLIVQYFPTKAEEPKNGFA